MIECRKRERERERRMGGGGEGRITLRVDIIYTEQSGEADSSF